MVSKTIKNVLIKANKILNDSKIDNPMFESTLLLSNLLKSDRSRLMIDYDKELTQDESETFFTMVEQRAKKMPIKYIFGHSEFMSLDFLVDSSTLIPRPETELLVEKALELIGDKSSAVIDIGAGSGCIGISLAHYNENLNVTLLDISEGAIDICQKNIIKHNLSDQINCLNMNILSEIPDSKFDLVVSNPPYITVEEYEDLMPDVKEYEPKSALVAPDNGLLFYKRIAEISNDILNPNGYLIFEVGYRQADSVIEILKEQKIYTDVKAYKDLNGIFRVITARRIK